MKGNIKAMALSMAAVFALSVIAIGAMAIKPAPAPAYVEPTGNLVITSNPQLTIATGSYVRLYDWVDGKFNHTWSGDGIGKVLIADVDNDGEKEVVSKKAVSTKIDKKTTITTNYIRVWNDGDGSSSPSIVVQTTNKDSCSVDIGDVDKDGKIEIVVSGTAADGSAEVWNCTDSTCTREATILGMGRNGFTVADADNDGYPEIMMGVGTGDNWYQPVIADYADGVYSITPLPMSTLCPLDDISVGEIDGTAGNEIFGSGYCNGNLFVWRYTNGAYKQVWNKQISNCFDMSNEIADINGDGKNEIAFEEHCMPAEMGYASDTLRIYKNDGTDSWSQLGAYDGAAGNRIDVMVSADVDGDDETELVVQNQIWDWDGSAMKKIQELPLINNAMYENSIA